MKENMARTATTAVSAKMGEYVMRLLVPVFVTTDTLGPHVSRCVPMVFMATTVQRSVVVWTVVYVGGRKADASVYRDILANIVKTVSVSSILRHGDLDELRRENTLFRFTV